MANNYATDLNSHIKMYEAVVNNDWKSVRDIFEETPDAFNAFSTGLSVPTQNPLHLAIDFNSHIRAYKAAINDDWDTARDVFEETPEAFNALFTNPSQTPLHVAVATRCSHRFVQNLVDYIWTAGNQMILRTRNTDRLTALHYAAMVGNTEAARLLIDKDPDMAQITSRYGHTALTMAAQGGHKETLCYLLHLTKDVIGEEGTSPYRGQPGADLLASTIYAGFYDVALYLVKNYPDLVMEKIRGTLYIDYSTALEVLATKPNAFQSGSKFGFWQRIIYSWIPVNEERALEAIIVNPVETCAQNGAYQANYQFIHFWRVFQYLGNMMCIFTFSSNYEFFRFWRVFHYLGNKIKPSLILGSVFQYLAPQMYESKVRHIQSKELVNLMCLAVMEKKDRALAWDVFGRAIFTAVDYGIYELIEQCCQHYPVVVNYKVKGLNLFMAAIRERQEKVYNLVYQMSAYKGFRSEERSGEGNALHMAGKLAPQHRLDTVTGVALQMQRELQWFKEVEKFVPQSYKEHLNREQKTPKMVFSSDHKGLLKEAKRWMKDTSSSATVVAALIVATAFAAILKQPGKHQDAGYILFAVSDAIALFSSSTSVMMFLSILNSRFAEEDFLYALPNRLTVGLISLFISIAAIMEAFSASFVLALQDKIWWIVVPAAMLPVVPVTLFLFLQYPLLVELVRSTYGRGIFYKQNNLLLH